MRGRRRPDHDALAVCAPGLEALVAAELGALGIRPGTPARGTVPFRASARQLYAANVWLRTAERVQVRVARFEAATLADLARRAAAVPWADLVAPDVPVLVRARSHRAALDHTGAVAERVATAVARVAPLATGDAPGPDDDPDDDPLGAHQLVMVRVVGDQVSISLDASGAPLHRRGWRRATAKAPLRETVAAAALAGAGWSPETPFVDPCCGSGTLAIEAALVARRLPPGHDRHFAFERWPGFEPGTWASVQGEARSRARPAAPAPILASDRDEGAVAAALTNAERAGVAADVEVRHAPVSALNPPSATDGALVTNPPWGGRLTGGDPRDLYARLGQVAAARLAGWTVAVVVPAGPDGLRLAGNLGVAVTTAWITTTGGTSVALVRGRLPSR